MFTSIAAISFVSGVESNTTPTEEVFFTKWGIEDIWLTVFKLGADLNLEKCCAKRKEYKQFGPPAMIG